jgi:hypothetical protein
MNVALNVSMHYTLRPRGRMATKFVPPNCNSKREYNQRQIQQHLWITYRAK